MCLCASSLASQGPSSLKTHTQMCLCSGDSVAVAPLARTQEKVNKARAHTNSMHHHQAQLFQLETSASRLSMQPLPYLGLGVAFQFPNKASSRSKSGSGTTKPAATSATVCGARAAGCPRSHISASSRSGQPTTTTTMPPASPTLLQFEAAMCGLWCARDYG